MHLFFHIFGLHLPGYGLMIALGVVTANVIALHLMRRYQLDGNDFLILEGYIFLGCFLGAKLLYLLVSIRQIDWSRMLDSAYFNEVMQGGFVFYGGLIGGLGCMLLAGRLHHIDYKSYMRHLIFLIPWIHGFGRIGCFLAGCCYGMPYQGALAVTFPETSMAPAGIPLFPVQLVEAILLFLLAISIYLLDQNAITHHTVAVYFIGYSIIRFFLEYVRYDTARGKLLCFSTSQWISLLLFFGTIIYLFRQRCKQ